MMRAWFLPYVDMKGTWGGRGERPAPSAAGVRAPVTAQRVSEENCPCACSEFTLRVLKIFPRQEHRSTAPVRARSAASTQRALLAAQMTTSALAVGGVALSFPAAPPVPTIVPVPPFFKCNTTPHRQDTQKTPPRPCAPGCPSFAEPPSPSPHRRIPPAPRCSVLAQKVPQSATPMPALHEKSPFMLLCFLLLHSKHTPTKVRPLPTG